MSEIRIAQPTAKPIVAGILNIVVGAGAVLGTIVMGIIILVADAFAGEGLGWLVPLVGIPLLILAAVAITGGVYAVKRRRWGWALAGSIATALMSNLLGIVSIILVAISKEEFAE